MPKVKLAEFSRRGAPPIDWLWAAVLERAMVLHMSRKDLADLAGVSYETMRDYIRKSPWAWPNEPRERLCAALGIEVKRTIEGKEI